MRLKIEWILVVGIVMVVGLTGCADKPLPGVDGPEPLAEPAKLSEASAEATEAIRALIPAAAGIQNAVMERVAASPSAPTPDSFESKTLTTMLFTYKTDPTELNEAEAEETTISIDMENAYGRAFRSTCLRGCRGCPR